MKPEDFPKEIQADLIPAPEGEFCYRCLACGRQAGIETLHYTCPDCGRVLLIYDRDPKRLKKFTPEKWRRIFDFRKMLTLPALKGIYRYHEFIGPVIPLSAVVYLGEGHTPMVAANPLLQEQAGLRFFFKNDGQNPSASFKDRGMASALSYIHFLVQTGHLSDVLAICASTGDTSAAAALYAAYLKPDIKSAVILPHGKVTPQQLLQPLASGASVFEVPGVFDDCMKVVERLSETYNVALLNSKNAWRVLGQESFAYEIAQDLEYDLADTVVVVPIGNAGNITAIMSGFIKFYETGIIETLPKIIGVQSEHANPVYRYYLEPDADRRKFVPVSVKPSVAQAAMIGNPVSMPRVIHLVAQYNRLAGEQKLFFIEVKEQEIMDWELIANRNGHIACTHGGETLAGLVRARARGIVGAHETAILDSTAHTLKFAGFTEMYFSRSFPQDFGIASDPQLINAPVLIEPVRPEKGDQDDMQAFVDSVSEKIAGALDLKKKEPS